MIKVNVTALYKLIKNKELVPTNTLAAESKALYKALKLEGGNHVSVFVSVDGHRVDVKAFDSDIRIRAMAAFITKIMYRWNDSNDRLEHHFGLPTDISSILDMKQLTKSEPSENNDYTYITVRTLAENYAGKKYQHTNEEWWCEKT